MFSSTHAVVLSVIASAGLALNSTFDLTRAILTPPPIEAFAAYSDPVKAGSEIVLDWQVIKRVDCIGSSQRVWNGEDGYSKREPISPTTLPVTDTWQNFHVRTQIPDTAPVGYLRLTVEGIYDCPEKRYSFILGPVVFRVSQ